MTIRMQLKPGGVNKQHNEAIDLEGGRAPSKDPDC
jgi:hypothetical protein